MSAANQQQLEAAVAAIRALHTRQDATPANVHAFTPIVSVTRNQAVASDMRAELAAIEVQKEALIALHSSVDALEHFYGDDFD
jgi:hypothetical protein